MEELAKTSALRVVEQGSLRLEDFFRSSGRKDEVYVVVKNSVFSVRVGWAERAEDERERLLRYNWDYELLYDSDELKRVPFVKTPPVKATAKVDEGSDCVVFSCKVAVLTSQHEDMFFRIRFRALEPRRRGVSGKQYAGIDGITHPIKVISKPDTSKRKRAVRDAGSGPKKVKLSEVEQLLEEISLMQMQNQNLIRRLQHYDAVPLHSGGATTTAASAPPAAAAAARGGALDKKRIDFGAAYSDLFEAFGRLIGEEAKRQRVQRVLQLLPTMAMVNEFYDMAQSALSVDAKSGAFFSGATLANSATTSSMTPGEMGSFMPPLFNTEDFVNINGLEIPVAPTQASTTTIEIDGLEFEILNFEEDAASANESCSCKNCNYKAEYDRAQIFGEQMLLPGAAVPQQSGK